MAKKTTQVSLDFAFYQSLKQFYDKNRCFIRSHYKDLSKKFLDFDDPKENSEKKTNKSKKKPLKSNQSRVSKKSKINKYKKSKPIQLKLLELINPSEKDYSNTIELYDFIPKYVWGKAERIQGKFLEPIEREFNCRGQSYQVRIAPARIKDADGISRDYFPGKREELVEDALRKIATAGQGIFLDDEAGVTFTLYQLQQELKLII
ncbi:MAG: hypothetical protein ACR2MD_18060 [Aridibacter sp.]